MSVQTTYDAAPVAEEGLRAGHGAYSAESGVAEGSAVRFGAAVILGTGDHKNSLPDTADALSNCATTAAYAGIVSRENEYATDQTALVAPVGGGQTAYVAKGGLLNVVTTGDVWVRVEDAVTRGSAAFYRTESGAGGGIFGGVRRGPDTPAG